MVGGDSMYAKVENGQVVYVPTSGVLQDGRTVSNYHLLPDETLLAEGWLPCEEVKPTYDEATQYLAVDTAVQQDGKVIVTYKAVDFEG
jgi:hypothetical protein